jgi:RNA polymerase sigma-70 factor (ECF subfamily)
MIRGTALIGKMGRFNFGGGIAVRPAELETDALLDRCLSDPQVRDHLFQRHRDRLRRMVMVHLDRRLSGRLDASDVVQETLAEATIQLPEYLKQRPIPFYPWLRGIAWRRLIAEHRRHIKSRNRSVEGEEPLVAALPDNSVADLARQLVGKGATPSADAVRRESIRHVRSAIEQLSPGDRELIVMRHVEQLSVRDVAAVLGISEAAVKTRHFRVVQRLHRLLTKQEGS